MTRVLNREPQRSGGAGNRALTRAFTRAVSLVLLLLPALPAWASPADVTVDDTDGSCRVRASFTAPVSRDIAWNVLADYDSIGRFVSSVRTSRMERQADGRFLLRQDAVGSVFMFKHRIQVLLEIEEKAGSRIHFHDVLGKDFRSYVGEWRITADSVGTCVVYEIEAQPKGSIARAFCRGPLRNAARDLLSQVRAEMIRRGAAATAARPDSSGK
jgi:hypothetical protein